MFYAFLGLLVLASAVHLLLSSSSSSSSSGSITVKRKPAETADTPPHSLTPSSERNNENGQDKKGGVSALPAIPPPGSRRPAIAALITNFLPTSRPGSLASPAPTTTTTDAEGCGFPPVVSRSAEEIESYGDFPDYAALTGIRLPAPYVEFDIEKALPRPYRPFRWAYHQTMGMFLFPTLTHELQAE